MIYDSIKVKKYWSKTSQRDFTSEELSIIDEAEVVKGLGNWRVKFTFKDGTYGYLPLWGEPQIMGNKHVSIGDKLDLSKCVVATISRKNRKSYYAVDIATIL